MAFLFGFTGVDILFDDSIFKVLDIPLEVFANSLVGIPHLIVCVSVPAHKTIIQ